jgi:hypothetical protein
MKKILLISLLLCIALQLSAQAPQQFSFQGVARDAAGKVIANTNVSLRLTIHEALPAGVNVYQETHKPLTSNGGIFTVSVGVGNDKSGSISDIKWSAGSFFLQVELDAAGGSNYIDLGATQLLSVPYALHAGQADKWKDGDPVVQTGVAQQGGILNPPTSFTKLIWYPRKVAFRAGITTTDAWDDGKIGIGSTAFGSNTESSGSFSFSVGRDSKASNDHSIVMGSKSIASGDDAVAIGNSNEATGSGAIAIGVNTKASGPNSVSIGLGVKSSGLGSIAIGSLTNAQGESSFSGGEGTFSKTFASTSLGSFNNIQDTPNGSTAALANSTDRLFQIGNGSNVNNLSNALTILRNGNIGIGNNALTPQFLLDVGGRARIKHSSGKTAGIYFDDSQNDAVGFVGMKTDKEIGLFNANKWLFWMDESGNAHITGNNYNTSDRRLKRDFSSLSNSLTKLSDLNGYHYFWKDSTMDQTLQTGLVAQEVEAMFPELVKTDDKGFKSVNYTGLIPHLIEAVKELNKRYGQVSAENEQLKTVLKRMDKLEVAIKILTPNNESASQQASIK